MRTFTIGFHEAGYNEAEHAKRWRSTSAPTTPSCTCRRSEALDGHSDAAGPLYDEPFADSSQIPTYPGLADSRASTSPCRLSGDGGDELFGGYNRYCAGRHRVAAALGWRLRTLRRAGGRPRDPAVSGALGRRRSVRVLPLLPRAPRAIRPRGDKLHKLAGLLALQTLARSVPASDARTGPTGEHRASGGREPPTMLTGLERCRACPAMSERMMYLDLVSYLPDDILVKVDRAAMAVSLETRVPLLDHRVVEFAWRLPLAMKVRAGQRGKWLLRQVLYQYVPRQLVERPKMGFGMPIDSWLRGRSRDWAEGLLSERTCGKMTVSIPRRSGRLAGASVRPAQLPVSAVERADVPGVARSPARPEFRPGGLTRRVVMRPPQPTNCLSVGAACSWMLSAVEQVIRVGRFGDVNPSGRQLVPRCRLSTYRLDT